MRCGLDAGAETRGAESSVITYCSVRGNPVEAVAVEEMMDRAKKKALA